MWILNFNIKCIVETWKHQKSTMKKTYTNQNTYREIDDCDFAPDHGSRTAWNCLKWTWEGAMEDNLWQSIPILEDTVRAGAVVAIWKP